MKIDPKDWKKIQEQMKAHVKEEVKALFSDLSSVARDVFLDAYLARDTEFLIVLRDQFPSVWKRLAQRLEVVKLNNDPHWDRG